MSRRPSIQRAISSKSLLSYPELVQRGGYVDEGEDKFAIGDAEMLIEYHNVPKKLLITGAIHGLLQFKFFPLLALILSCILSIMFLFSIFYWHASDVCGLGLTTFSEAWLFTFLAHTKASLAPSGENNRFWQGCASGGAALFVHLFVAQILTSVLLSSLAFNFQSISRRSISSFVTLTISQKARVSWNEGKVLFSLTVAERNEVSHRKVSDVCANVFVFDPISQCINNAAVNLVIGDVYLPQDVCFEIPKSVIFSNMELEQICPVCGKSCGDHLVKHVASMQDRQHSEALPLLEQAFNANFPDLSSQEAVGIIRRREVQFIVILEGSDPVTTDRVQVQKIYRNFDIISSEMFSANSVSICAKDACPEIDYKSFL